MTRIKPLALVVDDDGDFRTLAKKMLASLGFEVETCGTAEEFVELVSTLSPDLCLIDLRLGTASNGLLLLENLRMKLKTEIPVFVVSAEDDAKIIAHSLELGATDYLVKPIQKGVLASKLTPYFLSEGIARERPRFVPLAKEHHKGRLHAEFRIQSVDENGVTLIGADLITKGTQVRLRCPLFVQLLGRDDTVIVTVANTWIEASRGAFAVYCTFDDSAGDLRTSMRRWLASRTVTQSS